MIIKPSGIALACLHCVILHAGEELKVDPAAYVDPMIGTAGTGHTFPGALHPFGMVQLSPDTGVGGWERCSGYHYDDGTILGFSHTHQSGGGVGDLGDFLFMPLVGEVKLRPGESDLPDEGYRSRFSHDDEIAEPGYYSVLLKDYGIKAELTASPRVGFHRYTFPRTEEAYIVIDFTHVIRSFRGKNEWAYVQAQDDHTLTGYRIMAGGQAAERRIYFAAKFSRSFEYLGVALGERTWKEWRLWQGEDLRAFLQFSTREDLVVQVKVAISPVSMKNALENLETEVPHWNFEQVRQEARLAWNRELSKLQIDGSATDKKIFYTALYHANIHPSLYMDVNGEFNGSDQGAHEAEGFENYTIFSLWDTYRAHHPLHTIINTGRTNDWINSMLAHYRQSPYGILPKISMHGYETWLMIGYHSVPVIVDGYLKGIRGYDAQEAFEAVKATARSEKFTLDGRYTQLGYAAIDLEKEAASKTLEYSFDDWCIAQMAEALGADEAREEFAERAQYYRNIFDPETGFMRARNSEGEWATKNPSGEFDPLWARYGGDYTEGNAWQYSWYVPHDVYGLIELLGGREAFVEKLDALFTLEREQEEDEPKDISGLIGQYAHGNEPSHHIPYLYSYAGMPWRTQEIVGEVIERMYLATPDGLCGNDDSGQMSSWYIFSSLGFYPVAPGSGLYVLGRPSFREASIHLEDGKTFRVIAKNHAEENRYVQSVRLNGKLWEKSWMPHSAIMAGGELVFEMGPKPNKDWGVTQAALPPESVY